jgi:hypothetical protein
MLGNYQEELKGSYGCVNATDAITIDRLFKNTEIWKHFDRIECVNPKAEGSFITIATWIAYHILLTARHVLNGFTLSDIALFYNRKRYPVYLLEDGAQYGQDYALLYVKGVAGYPIICNVFSSPNTGSYFGCVKCEGNQWDYLKAQVPLTNNYHTLSFETTLEAINGCSGTPYINGQGEMFGFHLSGYKEHAIWAGRATGITFSQLLSNARNSQLFCLFFPIKGWSFHITYSYFFDDDFSISFSSIGQIDHAARDAALGATPQLSSLTGTQVLLRYFLKNKAKPKVGGFSSAEQNFINRWKNAWKKYACKYFTYRSKNEVKGDYKRLFNLLVKISNWEVFIRMPFKNDLDNAPHVWKALDTKKSFYSRTAGFQMGHKMGAVEYWAYGAGDKDSPAKGWLKTERIPNIIDRQEGIKDKYQVDTTYSKKINSLVTLYKPYKKSGHTVYDPDNGPTKKFMNESWNYHFQWWEINQRDGRLAGQKTRYKDFSPAGYEWKSNPVKLVKKNN